MTGKPLLIEITRVKCPFFRAGYALYIIPFFTVSVVLIMMLEVSLYIRLMLTGMSSMYCFYLFSTTISSILIDDSQLTIKNPFGQWTCYVTEIAFLSMHVSTLSCCCAFTIGLRSGKKKTFRFQTPQTNVGSFSETIRLLEEQFPNARHQRRFELRWFRSPK